MLFHVHPACGGVPLAVLAATKWMRDGYLLCVASGKRKIRSPRSCFYAVQPPEEIVEERHWEGAPAPKSLLATTPGHPSWGMKLLEA